MEAFIRYLDARVEAGRKEAEGLAAEGRGDDAVFAKVRTNIYEVCRSVANTLHDRPGAGPDAVRAQFDRLRAAWSAALGKAREHGDAAAAAIEETKLAALEDAVSRFPEAKA